MSGSWVFDTYLHDQKFHDKVIGLCIFWSVLFILDQYFHNDFFFITSGLLYDYEHRIDTEFRI